MGVFSMRYLGQVLFSDMPTEAPGLRKNTSALQPEGGTTKRRVLKYSNKLRLVYPFWCTSWQGLVSSASEEIGVGVLLSNKPLPEP
jgi:hypothetical protein